MFTFPDMSRAQKRKLLAHSTVERAVGCGAGPIRPSRIHSHRFNSSPRDYGEQHHIHRLTTPIWSGEEMDGWYMAALANRLCKTNGVYRGPAGTTFVFFTFGKVQLTKQT